MPLVSGTRLGPYEVVGPLGAGGMGEVYRARDTRLDRTVAIKILPAHLSSDPVRKQRFEREAKTISSLNHPHICTLHDIGSQDGIDYLVMECVEGETLAKRLERGPLPLEQVLRYGAQIADALDKAHCNGVVHRDLKPGNIMLTSTGAKLLDFGLAKPASALGVAATLSASAKNAPVTEEGTIVGTFQYMSPEQVEGKELDGRSDIFSFGAVLYEMVTGRRAFEGKSQLSVASAILEKEPEPISASKPMTPPVLDHVVRKCLAKVADERWQSARDLASELKWVAESAASNVGARTTKGVTKREWLIGAAVIVVAAAILFAGLFLREVQPDPHPVTRASLLLPEPLGQVFSANPGSPIALSPDGSQLVFVGAPAGKPSQLYVRQLDQQTITPIPNTEEATQPFFSPDGQWIGFFSNGKMRKVSVHGGPVTPLCDALIPHGASWATDEEIVYAPDLGSGLMRISRDGGTSQTLSKPDVKEKELSHRWPQVLPGNKAVLFTIQVTTQSSYDDAHIAVLSLQTGQWRTLIEGGSYARYVSSGHIVYAHAGALMAVPFDLASLRVTGPPAPAQEGVITTAATSGGAEYDVTDSGLLAYVPGSAHPPERVLVWVDRQGVGKELPAPVKTYVTAGISPDGKLLAAQILSGTQDIWIYEFARNTLTRFTFAEGAVPLWTPDSRRIIYRRRTPSFSLLSKLADGSGREEKLLGNDFGDATPYSVSPDGKTLLFGHYGQEGTLGIYALSLDGSRKVQPFLQSTFNQTSARFSPDGRWVVYGSNESGRPEVYVQPFPATGGKWMISTEGGVNPLWARSGREIFFRWEDKVMTVPVEMQPSFKAGTPRLLFRGTEYTFLGTGNYDVAPDGQHFLMIKEKQAPASSKEVSIVLNWTNELKRLAPPEKK